MAAVKLTDVRLCKDTIKKLSIIYTNFSTDVGANTCSHIINSDTQHYNDEDEGTYSSVGQSKIMKTYTDVRQVPHSITMEFNLVYGENTNYEADFKAPLKVQLNHTFSGLILSSTDPL